MFLGHMKDHLCETIFDLCKDGCTNGRAKRLIFEKNAFVITFDDVKMRVVVLKTILKQ